MCILIDANQAHAFTKPSPAMSAIVNWMASGGRVVTGGKLSDELFGTRFGLLMVELSRRGNLVVYPRSLVDQEIKAVKKLPIRSDDPHVLAIARISGSRVVVTNDNKLIADLKDKAICSGKRRAIRKRPEKGDMSVKAVSALLNEAQCK
jgi:hypothetical protein